MADVPMDAVDPWAVERVPVRSSMGRRFGLDAVSAGQRYTVAMAVILALLVSVFSKGPAAEGDDFLDRIGDGADVPAAVVTGPSTFAAPVAVETPPPAAMPPAMPFEPAPAPAPAPAEAPPAPAPSEPSSPSTTTPPEEEPESPLPVELPLSLP